MDIYRPIYHFLPEGNWMNDPNEVRIWLYGGRCLDYYT